MLISEMMSAFTFGQLYKFRYKVTNGTITLENLENSLTNSLLW